MRIRNALFALFTLTCLVWGQLYSGSISGVVRDPSGAVVPNAHVTLTDTAKGYTYAATSDASGLFAIHNLPPSTYKQSISAPGFGPYERSGIVLEVNANVSADADLEVMHAGQSVTVAQSAAPMIQTEDATTGQTLNRRAINDLPLINRNVFDLAFLAPGVSQAPGTAYGAGTPGGSNFPTNFVTEGSRNAQADILLDGVTAMNNESNSGILKALYVPPVDAVQEFKVQETNFGADIGNSGGVVINVVTRSGTNAFHGELFEFFRNNDLNANTFFANAAGIGQAHSERNDFGGTVGGPIIKNKTFFFFDYDGIRSLAGATATYGVPSAAERTGNFGELCGDAGGAFSAAGVCSKPAGQIYDPFTGTYSAAINGAVNRTPIPFNNMATYASPGNPLSPNNVAPGVPGNLIDPVSKILISKFPLPNLGVGTSSYNPYVNFTGNAGSTLSQNSFDVKVDHRFNDSNSLSVRFSHTWHTFLGTNFFNNAYDTSNQGPQVDNAYLGAVNYTHIFSPNTVLTVSAGYAYDYEASKGVAASFPGFNQVTTLGEPAYMLESGFIAPPAVALFSAYAGGASFNGNIGGQGWSIQNYGAETAHLISSVDHMMGNNELKIGGEVRRHKVNYTQPAWPDGVFSMDANGTAVSSNGGGGDAMATLLTGFVDNPTFRSYEIPASAASQSFQYGSFVQDNWHVNDRLTVNLGLRYDIESPKTERYNRLNYFDPSVSSPISGLQGAIEYTGVNGNPRTAFNTYFAEIQPRVGFAYRFGKDTTMRGGYGIYYDPSDLGASGTQLGGVQGFSADTNGPVTLPGNPAVPVMFLRNPFPSGIVQPTGNSLGTKEAIGDPVNAPIRTWNRVPQEQTWSFGIEHQFPWSMLADVEYVGRKGTHLYAQDFNSLDVVPPSVVNGYRSGQSATYNAQVANPFYGNPLIDPTGSLASRTVPAYQLTLPYPQYASVTGSFNPVANSIYNGLNLRLEKRFSAGVQFLMTYTFQKSIDDSSQGDSGYSFIEGGGQVFGPQDLYNLRLERSVSQFNIPQIFQFSFVYQIPYGRGQRFGSSINRIVNFFAGGWQLNGIYRWDDGLPVMLFYNAPTNAIIPTFNAPRPNLTAPLQVCGTGNLHDYFCNPQVVTAPAPYQDGTAPRTLSGLQIPGTNNLTASLFKSFPLGFREGARVEFRLEAFNTLNYVQFGGPNTTLQPGGASANTTFGQITSQANAPRQVQIGLKVYF